jgi:hypothetical protein
MIGLRERWGWGDDVSSRTAANGDACAARAKLVVTRRKIEGADLAKAPHPRDSSFARIDLATAKRGALPACVGMTFAVPTDLLNRAGALMQEACRLLR